MPCKFNFEIPGLGYLENNPGKPVRKNTKLQLPLWLARVLAIVGAEGGAGDGSGDVSGQGGDNVGEAGGSSGDGESFVELLTPEMFSVRVMNAIKTDGRSLDLHALSPHFLEVALKWVALFSDHQLGETIYELMLERALLVNNHASSVSLGSGDLGGAQGRRGLNESLRLLQQGHNSLGGNGNLGGDGSRGQGRGGDSGSTEAGGGAASSSSALSASQATNLAASNKFLLTLDESERALYKRAHDSYRDTKRWMIK